MRYLSGALFIAAALVLLAGSMALGQEKPKFHPGDHVRFTLPGEDPTTIKAPGYRVVATAGGYVFAEDLGDRGSYVSLPAEGLVVVPPPKNMPAKRVPVAELPEGVREKLAEGDVVHLRGAADGPVFRITGFAGDKAIVKGQDGSERSYPKVLLQQADPALFTAKPAAPGAGTVLVPGSSSPAGLRPGERQRPDGWIEVPDVGGRGVYLVAAGDAASLQAVRAEVDKKAGGRPDGLPTIPPAGIGGPTPAAPAPATCPNGQCRPAAPPAPRRCCGGWFGFGFRWGY